MANRQQNVALTLFCRFVKATKQCRFEPPPPSLQGAISGHYGKETKKHFFEGDGPSLSKMTKKADLLKKQYFAT